MTNERHHRIMAICQGNDVLENISEMILDIAQRETTHISQMNVFLQNLPPFYILKYIIESIGHQKYYSIIRQL